MAARRIPGFPLRCISRLSTASKGAIAAGWLKPGDRLPSVRELAVSLAINHNTVAKAYQELERERVIEVVRGRGTFVADPGERPRPDCGAHRTVARRVSSSLGGGISPGPQIRRRGTDLLGSA